MPSETQDSSSSPESAHPQRAVAPPPQHPRAESLPDGSGSRSRICNPAVAIDDFTVTCSPCNAPRASAGAHPSSAPAPAPAPHRSPQTHSVSDSAARSAEYALRPTQPRQFRLARSISSCRTAGSRTSSLIARTHRIIQRTCHPERSRRSCPENSYTDTKLGCPIQLCLGGKAQSRPAILAHRLVA